VAVTDFRVVSEPSTVLLVSLCLVGLEARKRGVQ
jgi:hypothetical protein